jgi:FkbM family methyltransferase
MKQGSRNIVNSAYAMIARSGILSTRLGRGLYEGLYNQYKRWGEVGSLEVLRQYVDKGSIVIDVGAHTGFFTRYFAEWVGTQGRVLAVEPEEVALAGLKRMIARQRIEQIVEIFQAVADEEPGRLFLEVDPLNPGNHHIAERGVPVKAIQIDDLMAERGWPRLSFMKIDVQGAEERVLRGAAGTLDKLHPFLLVELEDEPLRSMGSSAEAVLRYLEGKQYQFRRFHRGRLTSPLNMEEALQYCRGGSYTDFLFEHRPAPTDRA